MLYWFLGLSFEIDQAVDLNPRGGEIIQQVSQFIDNGKNWIFCSFCSYIPAS